MYLAGRLALVTGGASGIGEAVCHTLAGEGATVIVADKQLEPARKVAASLSGDAAHRAEYVDVGDSSSVEQLFAKIRSSSALPLSIVVNCAGILARSLLVDSTDEHFDEIMRVHLKGTFLVTRAASREMIRVGKELPEGGAAIVNLASLAAKSGWFAYGAYAAAKAGVVTLTKTAAQELATHGIRVNAVLPGWTETAMTEPLTEEIKAKVLSMTALKRAAQPKEVAEAVKFLCSPATSSYVTGVALEITGGFNM
ncbi:estradiol 17-beta-dehydrogenase 8 [Rhipicephalus sanguineus]|uniref:estradiol 17-beta-dehydrogenase 8 n=1 Tax=Rhipicephalus sanguineus TaxID=34632 RepID=UPI001893B600|nr:estradiol 17-beta-dehydrogenase 8 [Rhipicephalus sanguineus]